MRSLTAPQCEPTSDPYSTHLPVLREVLTAERPKRILEFGGGDYSTPLLLEHAEELVVVETDPKWRRRLAETYPQAQVVPRRPSPARFDLVFIDDGENAAHREETIHFVLTRRHPLTVIHDAETYLGTINRLSVHYEVFNHTHPATAICE